MFNFLICAEYFDEYLEFGKTQRLKTWTSVTDLFQSPITSQFLDFIHLMVFDLILYCVTVQAKNSHTNSYNNAVT